MEPTSLADSTHFSATNQPLPLVEPTPSDCTVSPEWQPMLPLLSTSLPKTVRKAPGQSPPRRQ